MSLTLRLKAPSGTRLDMTGIVPRKISGLSISDVSRLTLGGKDAIALADAFDISGAPGDTITIDGAGATLDGIGAGLCSGTINLRGDAGPYAGRKMTGGKLVIGGNAGNYLGSGMTGGMIHVTGNAGDAIGGVLAGDRFGMAGGMIVVSGNIGARAGEKMRRGTILIKGKTGTQAGARMLGGTIWAEGGLGADPGYMMRRGTLIAPHIERLLPTFVDCGRHDLLITRILSRYLIQELGALAPAPLPHFVRKMGGDMATIGKGEILLAV